MAKPTSDPFYLVKDDIQSSVRRSLAGIPAGPWASLAPRSSSN